MKTPRPLIATIACALAVSIFARAGAADPVAPAAPATTAAATTAAATTAAAPAAGFFFHDGDRAMILGDSITAQRMYSTLIESYVLSHFPQWKITFRNTGISGDSMSLRQRSGLDAGFARDLAPWAPTAVTIDFGMNDARDADAADGYAKVAGMLADKFAGIGTRIAFVTSSPEERYEPNQPAGSAYNLVLRRFSAGLKDVAAARNDLFIDQLDPMIATIEAGRAAGVISPTQGGPRLTGDGVHPNWAGHLVMATNILKGLNAPSLVSSVTIDAKTGAVQTEKATVTAVKTGDALTFTRLDEALPWPIDDGATLALKIPGFTPLADLSRYMLTVTNLTAPSYKLTIDGQDSGIFSQADLAAGVNLSQSPGPIKTQGTKLLAAITEKNTAFNSRWMQVQLGSAPGWIPRDQVEAARAVELKKDDESIAAQEAGIDALRIPVAHVFVIAPAG